MSVEMLTPIWERVLSRSPICPDDDFFDLGGDFKAALNLVAQIEESTGRRLPITAVSAAPTMAKMAVALELPEPRFPALTLIKAGAGGPPVYMHHGLGGSIMEAFPIGRQIRWAGAIYGIQTRGLDGFDPPHDRVEDMARVAVDTIVERQPHGPYHLVGISSGGIVILEAAVRLAERGELVAFLALLDTYPHPRFWPIRSSIDDIIRRVKGQGDIFSELSAREMLSYLASLPAKLVRELRYRAGEPRKLSSSTDPSLPAVLKHLQSANAAAFARFRPRPLRRPVKFLRAVPSTAFLADPALIWGKLNQQLEVDQAQSTHIDMLTKNASATADWLSHGLDQA